MHRRAFGVVRWEDSGDPIPGVRVGINAVGRVKGLGASTTGRRGEYDIRWREADKDGLSRLYVTVVDRRGRRLVTTYEVSTHVSSREVAMDITVPATSRPERDQRPTVQVGPLRLDANELARADEGLVIDVARAMVERDYEKKVRSRLEALSPDLVPSSHLRRTLCGTDLLETVEAIIRLKRWPREVALRVDDILRMRHLRDLEFATQVHLCPNFRITYQDSGPAAVDPDNSSQNVIDPGSNPPVTLATLPAGGVPTYIKRVCFWLERALATYINPPFSMRNPAAGGRIEVEINSAPFGGATSSVFYLNNALPPDVLCAVAVHELFHMVQFQYAGSGAWLSGLREGGATWAEDTAADFMNRYLDEAGTNFNGSGYMIQPHTSLESVGFRYKTSLLWRYIAEQHSSRINPPDEPLIGVETYRTIIERCEAGSWSSTDIRDAVRALPWYQDFYEFHYLDAARLDLTSAETTLGNFALACYLKDVGVAIPDSRFDFMEDEQNIFIDDVIATVVPGSPLQATLASVTLTGTGNVTTGASASFSSTLDRFASRYYEVTVDPSVTNVQLQFTAGAGLTSSVFQAVLIDATGAVREIYRTDASSYTKRFPNTVGGVGLQKITIVATAAASAGPFTVAASSAAAAPDVMVTRWHTVMKREYEIDSRNWAWTWVSPDIFVDNDLDGVADGEVFFNFDNKLHIRLHNKGNQAAAGIGVEFWYQDASGGLSSSWLPVVNTAGVTQTLSGLSLAAGASQTFAVDWSPAPSGASQHFCVRAIVSVPGDPNTDNKRVLSNFGNVKVKFRGFYDLKLWRRNPDLERARRIRVVAVPRGIPGLEIAARDLAVSSTVLPPGAEQLDTLRLSYWPPSRQPTEPVQIGHTRKDDCPCHEPVRWPRTGPDPKGDYPVDPRTLPPGVAGRPMVTIVHLADGIPLGGVTFVVDTSDTRAKAARRRTRRAAPRSKWSRK
jgi:hypothetical protein